MPGSAGTRYCRAASAFLPPLTTTTDTPSPTCSSPAVPADPRQLPLRGLQLLSRAGSPQLGSHQAAPGLHPSKGGIVGDGK